MEPTTAIGVAASASNALVTLFKHGFHYVEIPEEVEQFRHAIENLDSSIATTKRLRRVKSEFLDKATKADVDSSIERSEKVLESICKTIEGCRVDMDTKGSISVKNKLDWMLRGHPAFMARGMTLNSSIQVLSMHIGRMDSMLPPTITTAGSSLPSYSDVFLPLPCDDRLRGPSVRKKRSRLYSTSSQIAPSEADYPTSFQNTLSWLSEKEVVLPNTRPMSPDAETVSLLSFEEERPTARILSVTDLSCTGDYCTNDYCINHGNFQTAPLTNTQSLDSSRIVGEDQPAYRTLSGTPITLKTLRSSQRRRHKSGFV